MVRVPPLERSELPELKDLLQAVEAGMGFVPTSLYNMARVPAMLKAFSALHASIFAQGEVPAALKQLCAYVASRSAGCRYCQAHTSAHAVSMGVPEEKVDALWDFESSPLFDDGERAALRLAVAGGNSPGEATAAHFDDLRKHFTDNQIIEIVGAISVFGFLNRWNDTLATDLEAEPLHFAQAHLAPHGWEPGAHVS